ncbi:hypothetical protein DXG01_015999 [Tephrocybe rancida]|nr:hypothetical protein DXG01_015999 [Tephrocybe rancida]
MKILFLTTLAVGAALAQVGATPIRVFVVGGSEVQPTNLRFGHALGNNGLNGASKVAMVVRPAPKGKSTRVGCQGRGSRVRKGAVAISNAFRKIVGLPLIDDSSSVPHAGLPVEGDGIVRILPFVGTPTFVASSAKADDGPYLAHPRPHHHHGKHVGFRQRLASGPFVERLHVALMALGPWEGRAVAFVLGCGIGVLLRMFWVLAIVVYRLIKGPNDETKYTQILVVEEFSAPEPLSAAAPPTYTFADEKADKDRLVQ